MNLTELQYELRDIEKHISQLHFEIENMKPKTEGEKKKDFDVITRLAKQHPIKGLGISNASDVQKKLFISSLSYLLLAEERNMYARLLYLCRLAYGCNLKMTVEDIYTLGLEFESKDIDKLCMDLEKFKGSYLIEAFIIANLLEESSTKILSIIADIAEIMGCDHEEIRVLAQIAKSKLMDNLDIVNCIPLPSKNRWTGKFEDYISKSWIESQREKCIEICTKKYCKKTSLLGVQYHIVVDFPCTVKNSVESGSVVKNGTTIIEYEEEVNKELRKITAPKDGIAFFAKTKKKNAVSGKEDEYLCVYVVSYFDEYSDFCKWVENI